MAEKVVIAAIALLLDEEEKVKKKPYERSLWVRPWIHRRKQEGCFHKLFQELMKEDAQGFREYVRMDRAHYEYLVEKLRPSLAKQDTNMRECIKPDEICCVMLRYLATGESFRSLEFQFRISRKAISYIVYDVAVAIIDIFGKDYLQTPNTTEKCLEISEKFSHRWNFPNGVGDIDGKYIVYVL